MNCPRCGRETTGTSDRCPECGDVGADSASTRVVLETADASLLAVVQSLLTSAEIPFAVHGDGTVMPLGALGTGFFKKAFTATVRVPADRADEARALLEPIEEDHPIDP